MGNLLVSSPLRGCFGRASPSHYVKKGAHGQCHKTLQLKIPIMPRKARIGLQNYRHKSQIQDFLEAMEQAHKYLFFKQFCHHIEKMCTSTYILHLHMGWSEISRTQIKPFYPTISIIISFIFCFLNPRRIGILQCYAILKRELLFIWKESKSGQLYAQSFLP